MTQAQANQLLDEIIQLQSSYNQVKRSTINWTRLSALQQLSPRQNSFNRELARETLLEHVGHLPILAAAIHPHLQHTAEVDLGHSLAMIAIHDLAETMTGDISTYNKTTVDEQHEDEVARKLLPASQLSLYLEYEAHQTLASQFAKSIDKLAPPIMHLADQELASVVFVQAHITRDMFITQKQPHMQWDSTIASLYQACLHKLNPYFYQAN
jgi:putative hydrolase of HD superfamily